MYNMYMHFKYRFDRQRRFNSFDINMRNFMITHGVMGGTQIDTQIVKWGL